MSQSKAEKDVETAVLVKSAASELDALLERFTEAVAPTEHRPFEDISRELRYLQRRADTFLTGARGREETARA